MTHEVYEPMNALEYYRALQKAQGEVEDLRRELVCVKAERDRAMRACEQMGSQLVCLHAEQQDLIARYELAAKYPGDGERHQGVSVATQLVHAQYMREKAEKQLAERDARPSVPLHDREAMWHWLLATGHWKAPITLDSMIAILTKALGPEPEQGGEE